MLHKNDIVQWVPCEEGCIYAHLAGSVGIVTEDQASEGEVVEIMWIFGAVESPALSAHLKELTNGRPEAE